MDNHALLADSTEMNEAFLSSGTAGIALFLAAMEGRAGVLRARSSVAAARHRLEPFSGGITFCAALSNMTWGWYAWNGPWLIGVVLAVVLASVVFVTPRSLSFWLALRPLVAIATAASAGLLWVAYPAAR